MDETPKWEYRMLSMGGVLSDPKDIRLEEVLNEMGADGWEVVSAFCMDNSNRIRILAKRPLTSRARRQRTMPL